MLVDGHTFERHAIAAHLAGSPTNPVTGKALVDVSLAPNRALRDIIELWLQSRTHFGVELFSEDLISKYEYLGREWIWKGQPVAVLSLDTQPTDVDKLVQAGRLPHIVKVFGFNPRHLDTMQLVLELATHPPLNRVLRHAVESGRPLSTVLLLEIAAQVATGMQELATLHMNHGDLTLRNVHVFRFNPADPADTLVKLAGFGLRFRQETPEADSEEASEEAAAAAGGGPPKRLMTEKDLHAPSASDVWAFGKLLWTLFSGVESVLMEKELGEQLQATQVFPRPATCPVVVYDDIMVRCWTRNLADRPTFAVLVGLLRQTQKYYFF